MSRVDAGVDGEIFCTAGCGSARSLSSSLIWLMGAKAKGYVRHYCMVAVRRPSWKLISFVGVTAARVSVYVLSVADRCFEDIFIGLCTVLSSGS